MLVVSIAGDAEDILLVGGRGVSGGGLESSGLGSARRCHALGNRLPVIGLVALSLHQLTSSEPTVHTFHLMVCSSQPLRLMPVYVLLAGI